MRRLIAVGLLCTISLLMIAPLLSADADSALPLCCRRGGKHECGASSGEAHHGDAAQVRNAKRACPLFPAGISTPHAAKWSLQKAERFSGASASHALVFAVAESFYPQFWSRSYPKRGPPSLAS